MIERTLEAHNLINLSHFSDPDPDISPSINRSKVRLFEKMFILCSFGASTFLNVYNIKIFDHVILRLVKTIGSSVWCFRGAGTLHRATISWTIRASVLSGFPLLAIALLKPLGEARSV